MSKRPILSAVLLALLLVIAVPRARSAELAAEPAWIIPPGTASQSTGIYAFRTVVALRGVPAAVPIHVSADNRFLLFVNGIRIGEGPALGSAKHWRFSTYDIAHALHRGSNVIAATVWSFGDANANFQISLRPAFALWSEALPALNTGGTWQVRADRAWRLDPKAGKVGPGFVFQAADYDWSWMQAKDKGSWETPTIVPDPAWVLQADPLPAMEYSTTAAGAIVRSTAAMTLPLTISAHTHATLLLDRATLTTAYPSLTVSKGRNARITLTYAEALYDAHHQKGNRSDLTGKTMDLTLTHDVFLPDGHSHRTFTPLWWRSWRYLQVDVETQTQPVRLEALTAHFTAYPFEEKATLASSDPDLARIWDVGYRTLRLDAHETYMDCPYWEELQYIGDSRIEALTSYVVTGDDRLAQQALRAFADSSLPNGLTQSRFPSREYQLIPPFSLLWIGMLHDYWQYRPDHRLVRELLPQTRSVLDWFAHEQRPDGLYGFNEKPGYFELWNFVDWAPAYKKGVPPQDADGGSTVLSLQLVAALRDAAELEEAYGDAARAVAYRGNADRIAHRAYAAAWDATRGLMADAPSHTTYSQQANIMAVLLDVISAEDQKKVMGRLLEDELKGKAIYPANPAIIPASYYFRFYLARALDHAAMDDLYLRLLGPYRNMLGLGLSTWAEQPEPTRSDAHAWSSHPNFDLITLVAGIRPASPGFRTVSIAPHLGALTELAVSLPIPAGMLKASYKRTATGLEAEIELPPHTTGTIFSKDEAFALHEGLQHVVLPGQ